MTSTNPDTTDTARQVGPLHEAFADWLNDNFDAGITPEQIFLVTSKRNIFRKSDAYRVDLAATKAATRAAAAAAKASAKAQAAAVKEMKAATPPAKAAAKKPAAKAAAPAKEA